MEEKTEYYKAEIDKSLRYPLMAIARAKHIEIRTLKNKTDNLRKNKKADRLQNALADGTLTGCTGSFGFPPPTYDCKKCSDNGKCRRYTHFVFSRKIRTLTRRSVTIITGGHYQGNDFSSIVALPIRDAQIFLTLLKFAGTKDQHLVFLVDSHGNVLAYKTYEDWRETIDTEQITML